MLTLFIKGGPIMYLLFGCSIWGLYIIVYKLMYLKSNTLDVPSSITRIKHQISSLGKAHAIQELQSRRSIAFLIFSKSISIAELPREDVQDAFHEVTQKEVHEIDRQLSILSTIISIAPILGLLGTVLGLMDIFNVISGGAIGDATALSSGIAEALITTVTGLMIAAPFMFFHQLLSNKIQSFLLDIEWGVNELIRFIRSQGDLS